MKRTTLVLALFLFVAMMLCACKNQKGADDIQIEPEIGDSEEKLTVSTTHEADLISFVVFDSLKYVHLFNRECCKNIRNLKCE